MGLDKIENKSGWLVGGGVLASIVASICCIGPLVLTVLGISGAAALSKFETLRIPMIVFVLISFGIAGFSLYQKRNSCEQGSICADPSKFRRMVAFYWIGLVIAILGISSPQWVVFLFS
ncbi:MAG: mercury transporter [Bdellovibrionales bacterium CG10_big_fil_rev_8_21_14_0_10_45_34]|nr:MAG: mercury transporter [Bdellovibrionales bacterium CG10_big_fil_rev_8_21_14_0_10_45_34]